MASIRNAQYRDAIKRSNAARVAQIKERQRMLEQGNIAQRGMAQHAAAIANDNKLRFAQANKNAERIQDSRDRAALMERARMLEQGKMNQLLARLASEERRHESSLRARAVDQLAAMNSSGWPT